MPPGANVFKAIVRPRRARPDGVQDVRLEMFNWDGTPYSPGGGDVEVEDWITIPNSAMFNGWTSLAADYAVRYRKRPDGIVEMRGYAKPGSGSDKAFILPEGYRPTGLISDALVFPIVGYDSGASSPNKYPPCVFALNGDGSVYIQDFTAGSYYVHICNVRFATD